MENLIARGSKVKKLCVIKRGDKCYIPKTIPKERESNIYVYILIILLSLLVHYFLLFSGDFISFLGFYSFIILLSAIVYIVFYRFVLFVFEIEHLSSRYENNIQRILQAAFYLNNKAKLLIMFCMVFALGYTVYSITKYGFLLLAKWGTCVPWPSLWILFYLHQLLGLNDFPINNSILISKDDGLDYGSGMAYSFFYGYLNYILNRIGEPGHTLKEMMQVYEGKEGINFAMYRIFILIPKSLTCHEQVDHVSQIMEMRKSLLEKKITVAGVRDRIYKNSVYSVENPQINVQQTKNQNNFSKKVWVCVEYATPLKTFKEVIEKSMVHTEFYNRHKNDILLQFYLTLERILEHTKMSSMCELIYYEDSVSSHGKTYYHDVGKILLSKITELKKNERAKEE